MARSKFKLPSGWYRKAVDESLKELAQVLGPMTPANAWLFLYFCVVWKEKKDGKFYLHVNDRLSTKSGQALAYAAEKALQERLPSGAKLDRLIDQIGRRYAAERKQQGFTTRWQRNNVTGNGLEAALQVLIGQLCGELPSRMPELNTLQGFELAPVGYHSKPDLALFSARDFRLLISTKWTLRKERIGTYLHEAYFYKRRRPDLQVAFVVADFNPNILRWLVNDPLVDRVYHVGLPLLLDTHHPWLKKEREAEKLLSLLLNRKSSEAKEYSVFSELTDKIFPLDQLFVDVTQLKRQADQLSVDPSVEDALIDEDADEDF